MDAASFRQAPSEQIGDGAEHCDTFRRAALPFAAALRLGSLGTGVGYVEKAQVPVLRRSGDLSQRTLDGLRGKPAHGHFHVGLPGAEPHFADQYVVDPDGVALLHLDPLWFESSGRRC